MIFEPGTTIGGRYKLKEELAKGGMGSVWVARHLQLDIDVAIKFMDPEMVGSRDARARFEREAKASAQLQHANIVHVHDFGFEEGTPFLAMELLRGENLEDRLAREGSLPVPAIAALLVQIGRALRKAHEGGYVHRDLKPGNIFITGSGDEECVKLLDFGIARQIGKAVDGGTIPGGIMGSPHYMSPDQFRASKDIDGRSDLWSVGVILYRALTGQLPFPGETIGVVMENVLIAALPKASHCARDLPVGIDDFFARAFARDKAKRFQSAREMTDAFLELAGAARQSAVPPARDSAAPQQQVWAVPPAPVAVRAPALVPRAMEPRPQESRTAEPASPASTGMGDRALEALETLQRKALRGRGLIITSLVAVAIVGVLFMVAISPPSSRSDSSVPAPRDETNGASALRGPGGDVEDSACRDISDSRSPIPKGSARICVSAVGGSCTVTVNLTNRGPSPVSALVPPGVSRVYCLTRGGATQRREVNAIEGQTTSLVFDLK